jgi:CRP-like cAMP-binding protein/predicted MFS family arabinose efflux permease
MTTTSARNSGVRGALRHHDFRWLMAGLAISNIGSFAYNVAIYVYVWEATGSAGWAAALTVGRLLPSMLLAGVGGLLAERQERRGLLIKLDLANTVVMLALAAATSADLGVVLAILLAGATATISGVYYPATAALTPQVVPERDLASANAFQGIIENSSVVIGPAIGAGLAALVPLPMVFVLNAATFVLSAWCSSRIKARSATTDTSAGGSISLGRQLLDGAKAMTATTTTRVLVGSMLVTTSIWGVDTVLLVVLADERLGLGANGYGLLLAGLGAGGVLAAPLAARLGRSERLGRIIILSLLAYVLPTAVLLVSDLPAVAFGVMVIRGAGTLIAEVVAFTALQRLLPKDMLARVFGVMETVIVAAIVAGALVTAPSLRFLGVDGTLLLASVGVAVVVLATVPAARRVDRETAERRRALAPVVEQLRPLDLLADADEAALERMAIASELREVPIGEVVIHEGEDADAFYVLIGGRARVSAASTVAPGESQSLAELGAGDHFGEIGLLERRPRTATVEAITPLTLRRIEGEEFIGALSTAQPSAAFLEVTRRRYARTHPNDELTAVALDDPV